MKETGSIYIYLHAGGSRNHDWLILHMHACMGWSWHEIRQSGLVTLKYPYWQQAKQCLMRGVVSHTHTHTQCMHGTPMQHADAVCRGPVKSVGLLLPSNDVTNKRTGLADEGERPGE